MDCRMIILRCVELGDEKTSVYIPMHQIASICQSYVYEIPVIEIFTSDGISRSFTFITVMTPSGEHRIGVSNSYAVRDLVELLVNLELYGTHR